ncbi:hypothetical protein DP113_07285 [Brasilonema octagenarum UFV-E1]|uniref:Uncharacterized protein n=2 Tax=Brasilonema TaxID=383614 RepID=A0A856MBI8_9CYAN|nr:MULTISPECIES: hypothetical protein [Brasilonema]NMF64252.1 hypothetical protein [Brasilonema octagenarum UFV-OR1]QDL07734.1 hypothetical protein DP114_07330 [Brasilonema sennae CENA114]QDL14096.1 hypothetical protein DP113_07285 [Brasilonema octagenarum UFV-E1]
MPYSDFTLAKAKNTLSLTLDETRNLFRNVLGVQPSDLLTRLLDENLPLATAINSEKARSEFLIAPILSEVRRQQDYRISLFSGTEFNVEPAQGLSGFCDFILSASGEQYFISAPVVTVVEAKNENIIAGLGQCAATMLAAQIFNQRAGNDVEVIYGVVTTGTNWKFLTLEQNIVCIDSIEYYIKEVDKILGIFLQPFQGSLSKTSV